MTDIQIVDNVAARFRKKCKNKQDYEDLVQQARLIYCEQIGGYDPARGKLTGYISTVVYKKLLTYFDSASVRHGRMYHFSEEMSLFTHSVRQPDLSLLFALKSLTRKEKSILSGAIKKSKAPSKIRKSAELMSNLKKIENMLTKEII